jgi:transcriptional regulator with XRE-family HTH domain
VTAGELLRSARRRHGLTQRQLAARARTSQAAISRIERDVVSPAVATLAELLRLMNEELVLDAREVDWGHDVTLVRRNLELSVEGRMQQGLEWSRLVAANAGAARERG